MRIDLRLLIAVALVAGVVTACTTTTPLRGFGPNLTGAAPVGTADAAWYVWLHDGDSEAAHGLFKERTDAGATDAQTLFGQAETALATARYTEAATMHAAVLDAHPTHELAPSSAARLWMLRNHAPGWRKLVDGIGTEQPKIPNALTMGLLGRVYLEAAYRADRATLSARTFDGTAYGFSNHWRMAGPLSVYPSLDRDTLFAADDDDALADSYARQGFTEQTVDLVCDETRCDPPFKKTGVHILETWLELTKETSLVLALETRHDVLVEINGVPVVDVNRRSGDSSVLQARELTLGRGTHRVRVRMAVQGQNDDFALQLVPLAGPLPGTFSARSPGTPQGTVTVGDEDLIAAALDLPAADVWEAWVQTILAAEAGYVEKVLTATDSVTEAFPAFAGAPHARATAVHGAIGLDRGVSRESALALLRSALELDPGTLAAADRLGWMLVEDGRGEEALQILEAVFDARPTEYLVVLHLFQAFDILGWAPQARTTLSLAADLNRGNCAVVRRLLDQWEAQAIWPDHDEVLTEEQRACDEAQKAIAVRFDLPRGDRPRAIERFEALVARNPRSVDTLRTLAGLYRLEGRDEDADKTWAKARAAATDPIAIELSRFDDLVAQGKADEAKSLAEKALEGAPGSYGLRRAIAGLDGKNVLEDLRIDGRPIIEEFLEAPVGDASSGVYVLDYAATRVFPDASSITNTHIIIRVQNKDGIDAFGEVEIPSTALLLQVRTVKPDGTALEPDFVPGKPTISMPNLEPGDFVEYEYLEASEGSTLRAGSYEGIRFYFNIFDAPLLRSEYIVEIPEDWSPTIDTRGGAPTPEVTTVAGRKRHRFLVERGPQVYGEPSAAPSAEFLPSIRLSAKRDQVDVYRTWRDQVLSATRPNWLMRKAAAEALDGARGERERAHRLWKLVFENVTGDESGVFSRTAAETWSLGRGDRRAVLLTLLELGGIEAEMVFARPWSADNTPSDVLNTDTLQWVLVRARIDGEWVWLDPDLNHAIFGYVPSAIQGNIGLRLGAKDGGPLRVEIPTLPTQTDRRVVALDIALGNDGSVTGSVSETYVGEGAVTFRRILDSYTDRSELERAIEQSMSQSFPGVDITELTFENADDADRPLVMSYDLTAPDFARVSGDRMTLDRLFFASELTASYAQLPARKMTLVIGERVRIEVDAQIRIPDGMTLGTLPGPIDEQTPFGQVRRSVERTAEGARWKRTFILESPRVTAGQYPAFQEFARVCDTADPLRLEVIPQ